ncbi:type 1 glutamine amidotransferase family protein [Hypericibacter adhaerens]|jgi:putative intracellular protease/amidase|nr:hypothetical protein [Hypericibacter adhaerens]
MTFYPGDALKAGGGILADNDGLVAVNVVQDRELITGQNPRSDHDIAKQFVEALHRERVQMRAS